MAPYYRTLLLAAGGFIPVILLSVLLYLLSTASGLEVIGSVPEHIRIFAFGISIVLLTIMNVSATKIRLSQICQREKEMHQKKSLADIDNMNQ